MCTRVRGADEAASDSAIHTSPAVGTCTQHCTQPGLLHLTAADGRCVEGLCGWQLSRCSCMHAKSLTTQRTVVGAEVPERPAQLCTHTVTVQVLGALQVIGRSGAGWYLSGSCPYMP